MGARSFDFAPILLPAPRAAWYLGVSETKLRALPIARRELDGKRVYHRADLDAYADSLPIEGEAAPTGGQNGGW